jgi:hypothetical protein
MKNMYILCFMVKIHEVLVCKVRAVFIRIDQSVSCAKCPYSCGVCSRALSCNGILNVLLYTSQMYVYLHLTKGKRSCCCD